MAKTRLSLKSRCWLSLRSTFPQPDCMLARLARQRISRPLNSSVPCPRRWASDKAPPPQLRSSFDSAPRVRAKPAASDSMKYDTAAFDPPAWFAYSPWSSQFVGGMQGRVMIQSLLYALLIVAATNYIDSELFPSIQSDVAKYASPHELKLAIISLQQAFPEEGRVDTNPEVLKSAGSSDNSYHPAAPHSVLVRPQSTEDVVKVVKIARKFKVPIIPSSGATSLEGHFSGHPSGSICLDMSGMDQILQINVDDSDLICQAGARWEDINQTLKEKGIPLFFPVRSFVWSIGWSNNTWKLDPGPGATIGGMVGTGCSGTNAVRYGTAKAEWFLNLTVVIPNGEVIKTRRRSRKSSAGWDTTKLFIGAEGTLGIVTEATLRLAPALPTKVAMAQFPDVGKAVNAVQEILNSAYGSHVQCVELLDNHMMDAINKGGLVDKPYPVTDTLFLKLQGDDAAIKLTSKTIQAIVKKHGSSKFEFAATDAEADSLWQNRKYALMSTLAAYPGSKCWTTDVCVPVSNLPRLVLESKRDLANAGLRSTIVGHVGDGNFHALILFEDDKELEKVGDAVHRLVHLALDLDGTCTGEHGVGVGKKEYLTEELGEGTVALMRKVKKAIDPDDIMNPGKLLPDEKRA
ncbi:unnamed protein product [Mycena citricolor]|uniref:D-lactate dehydrogenase (cytochrome) n=1 Tax=Mycena citricolor TaxID=2018698 RepID=A0AAD2Q125_9AGAR|nr:unnamed protein product [Mycena citricolor]